ncbi:TPA: hypothetical protein HA338_17680 [Methanosarcina acetivorans]|uniref:Uncharacterized protein n=1 Tax=Methanosarcina acetivorans TaxID=2214 RepID=A0A832SME3_9EURY|nr:hypothetical protein [Methanosarcina acetivorans]HIH95752.1 hypothetical protein [Methanosarcina acetivorans]
MSFDAKKTFGKTTTIAEQLKGRSSLVSTPFWRGLERRA